jgi:hypothetical protein
MQSFLVLFAETFGVSELPEGFFLDSSASGLLNTMAALSPEAASAARTPEEATIAGHCGHILFLLEFFASHERGEPVAPDWPSSWNTREVDAAQWQDLQDQVRASYTALAGRLHARASLPDEAIGAAMLLLTHCAYHVGEIRQRLLWVAAG